MLFNHTKKFLPHMLYVALPYQEVFTLYEFCCLTLPRSLYLIRFTLFNLTKKFIPHMLCVVQTYRDVLSPCVFCCLTLPGRSYLICVILFILSQTFFPMRFLFFNLTKTFLLHMLYVVQTYQDVIPKCVSCCLTLPRSSYIKR
jgi:hypothetical protein